ncbi:MAG: glycosyltransferase [Candidatus Moraniibacteriota bacterium]
MQKVKLAIIIVNYKSQAYLKSCLDSIFAKIDPLVMLEVIVVNNDIESDLTSIQVAYPVVRIIQNKNNQGFGGGNNLGAKIARGDFLLFLNPDTEIINTNILELLKEFTKNPEIGIIGSQLLTTDDVVQEWSMGSELSLWGILKNKFKKEDTFRGKNIKKQSVGWVAGTALFIRRELFKKIDGFDEQFFMYFEDVDLCLRVRKLGKKVLYFPDFTILHYGGKSYNEKKIQKKQYYRSQDYYFQKHLGIFQLSLLRILRFIKYGV